MVHRSFMTLNYTEDRVQNMKRFPKGDEHHTNMLIIGKKKNKVPAASLHTLGHKAAHKYLFLRRSLPESLC